LKNLLEATEMICDLKGSVLALDAMVTALLQVMSDDARTAVRETLDDNAEVARTVLLHTAISEHTLAAFDRDVKRFVALLASPN
jgi:hypothetical protein